MRKAKGLTQQQLGEKTGSHWITISKLERGEMKMTFEWASKLAEALGVDVHELMSIDVSKVINIDGLVIDRGRIKAWADYGSGPIPTFRVFTDIFEQENDEWLIIDTDDLYPTFQRGDLIRVTDVPIGDIKAMVNRLCFVEIKNAEPRFVLGVLTPGGAPGTHTMRPVQGAPIVDVEIERVSRVNMAIFMPTAGGRESYYAKSKSAESEKT